jgi:Stress responsive A/B Barrel Domain
MTNILRGGLFAAVVFGLYWNMADSAALPAADEGPKVIHSVYYSLKDNSVEAKKKLLDSCKGYLSRQPEVVYFAAGMMGEDLKRTVNQDRDFDVALYMVFKNKAAFQTFHEGNDRTKFIDENKDNWKKVRVFDSVVD